MRGPFCVLKDIPMNYLNDEIRSLLLESADELQMPPLVLATIISYETAGTFDPRKKGPTTQWGQHQGFIQFGEPQAQEHGVNWDDPVRSQLGRTGAVVSYFRKNGWQPGMSEEDAYSIVNAGAPGLGHRTDANNGGRPARLPIRSATSLAPTATRLGNSSAASSWSMR